MHEDIKTLLEALNQQVKDLSAIYRRAANQFGISDNEFRVWYALLTLGEELAET